MLCDHVFVDLLHVFSPFWYLFLTNVKSALLFGLRLGLDRTVQNVARFIAIAVVDDHGLRLFHFKAFPELLIVGVVIGGVIGGVFGDGVGGV